MAHRPPLRASGRTLRSPAPFGGGALRSPPTCPAPTTAPASLASPPLFASLKRGGGALARLHALAPCLLVAHRPPLRASGRTLRSPAPFGGGALRSPPTCPAPTTAPASLASPPLFASLKRGGGALARLHALVPCLLFLAQNPANVADNVTPNNQQRKK